MRSEDVTKNMVMKLGKAEDMKSRLQSYHTTDKSMYIVKKWKVNDIDTVERVILDVFSDMTVSLRSEWFYVYDEDKFILDLTAVIEVVNSLLTNERIEQLRDRYIEDTSLVLPSENTVIQRSRSRSPRKKQEKYTDELEEYKKNKGISRFKPGEKQKLESVLSNGGKINPVVE